MKEVSSLVALPSIIYKDRSKTVASQNQREPLFFAEMKIFADEIPDMEIEHEIIK
ncbi:MAG: hypothetical protein ACTSWQ_06205 [Candidatus Thorarchaeota archaeon]